MGVGSGNGTAASDKGKRKAQSLRVVEPTNDTHALTGTSAFQQQQQQQEAMQPAKKKGKGAQTTGGGAPTQQPQQMVAQVSQASGHPQMTMQAQMTQPNAQQWAMTTQAPPYYFMNQLPMNAPPGSMPMMYSGQPFVQQTTGERGAPMMQPYFSTSQPTIPGTMQGIPPTSQGMFQYPMGFPLMMMGPNVSVPGMQGGMQAQMMRRDSGMNYEPIQFHQQFAPQMFQTQQQAQVQQQQVQQQQQAHQQQHMSVQQQMPSIQMTMPVSVPPTTSHIQPFRKPTLLPPEVQASNQAQAKKTRTKIVSSSKSKASSTGAAAVASRVPASVAPKTRPAIQSPYFGTGTKCDHFKPGIPGHFQRHDDVRAVPKVPPSFADVVGQPDFRRRLEVLGPLRAQAISSQIDEIAKCEEEARDSMDNVSAKIKKLLEKEEQTAEARRIFHDCNVNLELAKMGASTTKAKLLECSRQYNLVLGHHENSIYRMLKKFEQRPTTRSGTR
eukprot:m.79212 g.79212  ORF g.79212 m.79212 type:complete len:496 (+) comp12560_c0_seq1:128-1615(+)